MCIHNSGYIICSPFVHGAHGHAMAERWVTEQWCHGHSAWSMAFQALALVQSQLLGDWCWKWFVPCFWGWGILFGVVDVDHRPTSKYSLAIYCNSIQCIQLYRFIFSNPIHPFRSPNLSLKNPSPKIYTPLSANQSTKSIPKRPFSKIQTPPKKSLLFQVMISLFLPSLYADQLHVPLTSIGHVTSAVQIFDALSDPLLGYFSAARQHARAGCLGWK